MFYPGCFTQGQRPIVSKAVVKSGYMLESPVSIRRYLNLIGVTMRPVRIISRKGQGSERICPCIWVTRFKVNSAAC